LIKERIKMKKSWQIGVIGSAGAEEYPEKMGITNKNLIIAQEIGKLLAKNNCVVVTGGKGGIMEAAARGAKMAKGQTVGIISGSDRFTSNDFTDIEVISGSAAAGFDEFLLVMMSDALIVIDGGAGTLEEMTIAYRNKKPIVVLGQSGGWAEKLADSFLDKRETIKIESAKNAKQAVVEALKSAQKSLHTRPL
jgi:uncharacterized protein (TIGR00725 family)